MNKNKQSNKISTFSITTITIVLIFAQLFIQPAFAATTTTTSPTIVSGSDIIISLVNQNPDPAAAGDVVELRIGVQNQGQNSRENLVIEAIPNYPFTQLQGEKLVNDIGTLSGHQVESNQQIIKFKLGVDTHSSAGTYNIKVWTYQ